MSIYIGKLEFEGTFSGLDQIECDPGLYALLLRENDDYQLLEVGEHDSVKDCLVRRLQSELSSLLEGRDFEIAVYYTDDLPTSERQQLREEIVAEFEEEGESAVISGNVLAFSR